MSTHHSTKSGRSVKSKKWEWHDAYLPVDVVKAFARGKLSPSGLKILMVVRSLTSTNNQRWCWSNNRYFATAFRQTSITWISKTISDLLKAGFLQQRLKDGRRQLQLSWSWKLHKPDEPLLKTVRGLTENSKGGLTENSKDKQSNKEARKKNSPASPGESVFSLNESSGKKNKRHISNTARRLARLLYDKIVGEKKIKSNTLPFAQWPSLMQKIIKRYDKSRVRKVVIWYVRHFGEDYIPEAFSIASFSQKFIRIESAMNKSISKKEFEDKDPDWMRQYKKWKSDPEQYLHPDERL